MTAGLPGTGIGGLFYLIIALLMPLREVWLMATGRSDRRRWKLIGQQFAIAAGMIGSIYLTGWMLGLHLRVPAPSGVGGQILATIPSAIYVAPAFLSLTTLGLVLVGVELWSWLARRRPVRRAPMPLDLRGSTLRHLVLDARRRAGSDAEAA